MEAPEWKKGYPASTVFQFLMYSGLMFGSWYMVRWKTRQPDPEREQQEGRHDEEVESAGTRTDDDEKHVGSSSALPAGPAVAVVAPAAAADDQAGRR